MKTSIIPIFIPHIGCPMDCVFCNQRRISGSLLPATAEDVREQVELALRKIPKEVKPQIAFYGGSFTAIPVSEQEALLNAAHDFMLRGEVSSLRLSTRPDAIDTEILNRLKKYGVHTIELGSQSMDDAVLYATNRGHRAADTVSAAELIKSQGFELILQMMTGLPSSDMAADIETAKKIANLKPNGVRIYPTVIVRDTALFDMWQRGEYREHTIEDAVSVCAEIYEIFREAEVPIIRLGLNPTEDLSGGSAAGGAYHPALGELVLSRVFYNRIEPKLSAARSAKEIKISVHPSRVSAMVGQRRENIQKIRSKFDIMSIKVVGDAAERDEISLQIVRL